jgi:hypothetical protein
VVTGNPLRVRGWSMQAERRSRKERGGRERIVGSGFVHQ